MTNPATIAKGLTEAQRGDCDVWRFPGTDYRTCMACGACWRTAEQWQDASCAGRAVAAELEGE
jgi:multimeric flavodoxin WrbA